MLSEPFVTFYGMNFFMFSQLGNASIIVSNYNSKIDIVGQ